MKFYREIKQSTGMQFKRRIGLVAPASPGQFDEPVRNQVGNGGDFNVGMVLERECRPEPAVAVAGNAHSDFSVLLNGTFQSLETVRQVFSYFGLKKIVEKKSSFRIERD